MLLTALLGWLDREQRDVIAYLREENRAVKLQLGCRRLQLDDRQGQVRRCWDIASADAPSRSSWRLQFSDSTAPR